MKIPKLTKLDPELEARFPEEIRKVRQFYFEVLEAEEDGSKRTKS